MKKITLSIILFSLLPILLIPTTSIGAGNPTGGQPFVPCGNPGQPDCSIGCFFVMLARIYNFIVWDIAGPLAILMLIIGGVLLMASGLSPSMNALGKKILWAAVIGLVLVFCSWLIVNFILTALGYNQGSWFNQSLTC